MRPSWRPGCHAITRAPDAECAGTDTDPHNILDEMRTVGTVARAAAGTIDDLNTSETCVSVTRNQIGGSGAMAAPAAAAFNASASQG